ncbi:transposase [Sporomusa termitida]|uniref:Transposase IS200 like protein n=1 Tax=Sporomusa termitida TaxID=2377 RepID=A0A517DNV3_9FIRM|nr:transposase [Sporomusa termitida]QDR78936.1 Transposase IS200 like protein [Sporomusa termitida]
MARKPREKSSSGIYHILLRGINRQSIFEEDEDRLKFLESLVKCKEISQCRIFAYCLMDNHIHILLQTGREPLGRMVQRLSSSYVIWYNGRHDRCGHLFQERFKSEPVDTDSYFLTVLRYIHQNPVQAKIVGDAAAYRWSSYHEYTGDKQFVDREYALAMFADTTAAAIARFVRFSNTANSDSCLELPASKISVSDDDFRNMIRQQFGIEPIQVARQTREQQDAILRALKAVEGAKIRQLARITGLAATRVWKA